MDNGNNGGNTANTDGVSTFNQNNLEESLNRLFNMARSRASDAIGWYAKNRKPKKFSASIIRFSAVILFSLAGLAPVLAGAGVTDIGGVKLINSGYVFAAVAAALIGLDKFFGLSSGWIRYITTELSIEKSLGEFEMDWVIANACLDQDQEEKNCPGKRLQLLKGFMAKVDGLIEDETMQWASEFQGALAMLEKSIAKSRETMRPGAVQLTIQRGAGIHSGVSVYLDGQLREQVTGASTTISNISSGQHEVRISGLNQTGETVQAAKVFEVPAGGIANVTLKIE